MVRATTNTTTTEEPTVEPLTSPEAEQLVASGARPVDSATVEALIKQMTEMQDRINSLSQAAGVPSDPIDAHVVAIRQHVDQVANAHPNHDFSELKTLLGELPPTAELTKELTELLKDTVEDHFLKFGNIRHDLDYVRALATSLHRIFQKKAISA